MRGTAIPEGPLRVGVDTGGTFTDIAVVWPGGSAFLKVPSTPRDPARAVLEGLSRLGVNRPSASVAHGSTVATNALLERTGGPAAFFTTAGFEDLIEIGRQARPFLYDWNARGPEPLVPRALRLGVAERTDASGRRGGLDPVERRRLSRLAEGLARRGVRCAAVGFLHSYRNGAAERAVGRILSASGLRTTLSHAIAGEYREFERFSTAVANAWLQPVFAEHLDALGAGIRGTLRVLQSSGLTAAVRTVSREPVRAVLSGPAGGVLAASAVAARSRLGPVITLDMGGTSTDVALLEDPARVLHVHESDIAGIALRLKSVQVETVGAGGGSIARLDAGGALRVGPDSAGADPGPACYGRGTEPTVTDAHLLLGRLGAGDLLGGAMRLDRARAREAIARLGAAMGRPALQTALGILAVATSSMEQALRAVSLRRGHDPRRFTLVAYGGASALHACALAGGVGLRRIVVPPSPGTFSALGVALAPAGTDVARTVLLPESSAPALEPLWRELERSASRVLAREGVAVSRLRFERTADLRWRGQSHEISVPGDGDVRRAFREAYRRLYGEPGSRREAEIVTLRVRAREMQAGPARQRRQPVRGGSPRPSGREPMVVEGRALRTPWFHREELPAGRRIPGPARIVEYSATTVVLPGWTARIGVEGLLFIERARDARAGGR